MEGRAAGALHTFRLRNSPSTSGVAVLEDGAKNHNTTRSSSDSGHQSSHTGGGGEQRVHVHTNKEGGVHVLGVGAEDDVAGAGAA